MDEHEPQSQTWDWSLSSHARAHISALKQEWESYTELSRRLLLVGAGLALFPYLCLALSLWFSAYPVLAGLVVFGAGAHAWCASTLLLTWGSTVFIEQAAHQPRTQETNQAHVQ